MGESEDSRSRNVEMHAEADLYVEKIGSNSSFVLWGQEYAAALALEEIQDGAGRQLVNAAGEATEALLERAREA